MYYYLDTRANDSHPHARAGAQHGQYLPYKTDEDSVLQDIISFIFPPRLQELAIDKMKALKGSTTFQSCMSFLSWIDKNCGLATSLPKLEWDTSVINMSDDNYSDNKQLKQEIGKICTTYRQVQMNEDRPGSDPHQESIRLLHQSICNILDATHL